MNWWCGNRHDPGCKLSLFGDSITQEFHTAKTQVFVYSIMLSESWLLFAAMGVVWLKIDHTLKIYDLLADWFLKQIHLINAAFSALKLCKNCLVEWDVGYRHTPQIQIEFSTLIWYYA